MSGHIENAGKKGYCMMYFFIGFFLFIALWASVYYSNFALEF
ncbi:MAG: hypothetical protein AB8F94_21935 [Saprospiraceae bacterium]